jgi:alkanesulfonate monooxygenase SsuD/methylene tetrahydromethanopterin reductase-like flavin-dependent oxidoreductase (luciferase family)
VSSSMWRHPALIAAAAATIDHVSGGRLVFGLGVGGHDLAFEQYGLRQPPLAIRFEELDETCRILRLLWRGGPANFSGKHFQLHDAYLSPTPVQSHIPLVIGGAGEHRTLPLAAEHADIWNCLALPPSQYGSKTAILERHCARLGRNHGAIRRSLTFRAIISSDDRGAEQARLRIVNDGSGRAADLDEYISFGSAQECLDQLVPYLELGVRDFLLGTRPPLDWETLRRFAQDVAPSLRSLATP